MVRGKGSMRDKQKVCTAYLGFMLKDQVYFCNMLISSSRWMRAYIWLMTVNFHDPDFIISSLYQSLSHCIWLVSVKSKGFLAVFRSVHTESILCFSLFWEYLTVILHLCIWLLRYQEDQNRGKANWEHLNEDLHVLITVEDSENRARVKLQRAVDEVKKLLVPMVSCAAHWFQMCDYISSYCIAGCVLKDKAMHARMEPATVMIYIVCPSLRQVLLSAIRFLYSSSISAFTGGNFRGLAAVLLSMNQMFGWPNPTSLS